MTKDGVSDIEPLLRKLKRFERLSEADQMALRSLGLKAYDVAARMDLIQEGDQPQDGFLILQGFACRFKLRRKGQRTILAYLVPGDYSDPASGLLSRMDHGIATLSACRLSRIEPVHMQQLLERPVLSRALRKAALVDEAIAREWLVNVGRRMAVERVAHLLCEVHARLQVVGLVTNDGYDLQITQDQLGDTLGLSSVHINRTLQVLRFRGLVKLYGKHLTISNLRQLQAVAEFSSEYLHLK